MRIRYLSAVGLVMGSFAVPGTVSGAACTVSGATILDAMSQYTEHCTEPVVDCDPLDGRWYCSSERVDDNSVLVVHDAMSGVSEPGTNEPAAVSAGTDTTNTAISSCIDIDGDGWGWNGVSSCQIQALPVQEVEQTASTDSSQSKLSAGCIDDDGDGWGWNGVSSCQLPAQSVDAVAQTANADSSQPKSSASCIDDDSDGWGWDGVASCRVSTYSATEADGQTIQTNDYTATNTATNTTANTTRNTADNTANYAPSCSAPYGPHDITDIVLVTGQSNVTGAQTSVAATLDQWGKVVEFHQPDNAHPRVFAWTVDPQNNNAGVGWQVAELNQSWHDSAPGVGGIARNNFGFHFAKQVVEQSSCRVVGIIMVSEGGKGISHWNYNAPGWVQVVRQVNEATAAIGRTSIDGVLWHQGESDWIIDGTCFTGSTCRNNQPDYYAQMLYSGIADHSIPNPVGGSALIDRLRKESWFSAGKPFIAGETINAPVNDHLNKLNTDDDRWTACVHSDVNSGLGIRADDPYKNHYNAAGLRELGARYAAEYLKMTGN